MKVLWCNILLASKLMFDEFERLAYAFVFLDKLRILRPVRKKLENPPLVQPIRRISTSIVPQRRIEIFAPITRIEVNIASDVHQVWVRTDA